MRDQFEAGHTVQFTFASSVSPDNAPLLTVTGSGDSIVASLTATSSGSNLYYAMVTMPDITGVHVAEWYAEKTVSGTTYPFYKREVFNVVRTTRR